MNLGPESVENLGSEKVNAGKAKAVKFQAEKFKKTFKRLNSKDLRTDMNKFKSKVKDLGETVQKKGQEQIDHLLSSVKSPALKEFLISLNSKGEKGPIEAFRSLAKEQKIKIEKAADQLASKVSEVKEQGSRLFETELTQLLGKGVFDRATKVRESLKKSKETAKVRADEVTVKVKAQATEKAEKVKSEITKSAKTLKSKVTALKKTAKAKTKSVGIVKKKAKKKSSKSSAKKTNA